MVFLVEYKFYVLGDVLREVLAILVAAVRPMAPKVDSGMQLTSIFSFNYLI